MKIHLYVLTGFVNCNHTNEFEIDDEEWNAMSEKERYETCSEAARELMNNEIEYGYYLDGEEEPF